jgi:hypothetical protein
MMQIKSAVAGDNPGLDANQRMSPPADHHAATDHGGLDVARSSRKTPARTRQL